MHAFTSHTMLGLDRFDYSVPFLRFGLQVILILRHSHVQSLWLSVVHERMHQDRVAHGCIR